MPYITNIEFNNAIGEDVSLEVSTNEDFNETNLEIYSIEHEGVNIYDAKENYFNHQVLGDLEIVRVDLYDTKQFLDYVEKYILEPLEY